MGLASGSSAGGQTERYLLTGRPWRDNVPRRQEFEAANPDLEITSDLGGNNWAASGHLSSGDPVAVTGGSLGGLLDRLGAA
jgi:hypothetical protein